METMQFIAYTPQQLEEVIFKTVKELFETYFNTIKPKQPDEFLSRKDVAQLLKVDLSTVSNWNQVN